MLARFLSKAPPDAVTRIGGERQLEQGTTETLESFRARLLDAWTVWQFAGTAYGVLLALYYAGYTNALIAIPNGFIYSLDGSQQLVATASPPLVFTKGFWNEFRIIFPQPLNPSWSPIPGNLSDEVQAIRRLVVRWKAGHALFDGMVVMESGAIWGYPTTQLWGQALLNWGGVTTFWDGA